MANKKVSVSDSDLSGLPPQDWNYEQSVAKIEHIVDRIESGKLELAEVFEEFATASEYLRQCESFLQEKRQQVNLSIENLVDEAEPF